MTMCLSGTAQHIKDNREKNTQIMFLHYGGNKIMFTCVQCDACIMWEYLLSVKRLGRVLSLPNRPTVTKLRHIFLEHDSLCSCKKHNLVTAVAAMLKI